jgi:beta-N-acetylhexosaminidase
VISVYFPANVALTIGVNDFRLGNEVLLEERIDLIQDKSIALITNSSGAISNGRSFVDALFDYEDVKIVKIFSPEHGFRVDDYDADHIDKITGLKIKTLYGKNKKPSYNDLEDVDILIYDIQDVGARFYTFINTMYYCMEAAYSSDKTMIVCDRPMLGNPAYVDGFVLEEDVKSFVGLLDIPVAYGMTCGELANFINGEYFDGGLKLQIIEMKNYNRATDYESLNLVWNKPSPSMYFPSTAVVYPGTCFLEGTNFSEGRGTDKPFEYVGSPYCDASLFKEALDSYGFKGVEFEEVSFIPTKISSPSNPPKYVDKICEGIYIKVTDKKTFEPVKVGIAVLVSLNKLLPDFKFRKDNYIDKLAGTRSLREMINKDFSIEEIINYYENGLSEFKTLREEYLLY